MYSWFFVLTFGTVSQRRCRIVSCTVCRNLFVDPDVLRLARRVNVLSEANRKVL
jgi:hypothetical protein